MNKMKGKWKSIHNIWETVLMCLIDKKKTPLKLNKKDKLQLKNRIKQRPWIESSQIKAIIHSQCAYETLPNYVSNHISALENMLRLSDWLGVLSVALSVLLRVQGINILSCCWQECKLVWLI